MKTLYAAALSILFCCGLAFGQTQSTRPTLYTEIDTRLPSGTASISATSLRAMLKDITASSLILNTDGTPLYSTGSYTNPSWIVSLPYSKITGTPTFASIATTGAFTDLASHPSTLAGYGITDAQPFDADLTALAALSGTNTIYYRSGANTWTAVTIGSNLTFSSGTLSATGGGGSGTVTSTSVTTANGVSGSVANATTTPAFTFTLGDITPSSVVASGAVSGSNLSGTNTGDQTITLTGAVTGSGTGSFATTLASNLALGGVPTAATAAALTNTTQLATTAFVTSAISAKDSATTTLTGHTISGSANTLTNLPAANISGVIPIGNLATGTPNGSKFIRDDGTLQLIPGGGDALTASPLSQFAATTSAQLLGVLSDETGTGVAVFATSPTLVTPTIGVATATTVNKVTITAPASNAVLTIVNGKTLTASNTLTFSGTDSSTLNVGGGGTLGTAAYTATSAYEVPLTFSTGLTRTTNTITIGSGAITNAMLAGSIDLTTKVTGVLPVANYATGSATGSKFVRDDGVLAVPPGSGTVTSASVTTANGVSASVATSTTTPAFTFTLGAITPSSIVSSALTISRTNLSAGTALTLGTNYYDTLSANRTLTFSGTAVEGSQTSVKFNVSAVVTLTFPSSKRLGEADSAITSLKIYPGCHYFNWVRVGSEYIMSDSVGILSNDVATVAPTTTDDSSLGYSAHSKWINTSSGNLYECSDATASAAVWKQLGSSAGTVTSVIAGTGLSGGTITSTGTIAIDSTVATLTGSQTLTNKSIVATQLTGTLQSGQEPAHTGDVTNSAGSLTTVLANIPTATPAAGSILATAITAPSTPSAGKGAIYVDSTSKNISVKDDAGTVKHGVQTNTGSSNNFLTAISDAGVVSTAQPAFTNISGTLGATQFPALTGDVTTSSGALASTIATNAVTNAKAAQMVAHTYKGNNTGSTANAADLTIAQVNADLAPTINAQTGTTYTLVIGDSNNVVSMSNASANTLTVPPNSSVAFPVGSYVLVKQTGAGASSVAAGAGVTINSPGGLAVGAQYAYSTLFKVATDTWDMIASSSVSAAAVVGTTTNDNAVAGRLGESVTSSIASGSAVSLTTATAANVTSISLTAGDWDVSGNANFTAASATMTGAVGGISSTTATLPTDGTEVYSGVQTTIISETNSVSLPRKRITIASTTTVYLVAKATFSAGTISGFGSISARRVR